ncbi:hypothetical protein THAOC_29260, partial [Thalassiosira oceanica]
GGGRRPRAGGGGGRRGRRGRARGGPAGRPPDPSPQSTAVANRTKTTGGRNRTDGAAQWRRRGQDADESGARSAGGSAASSGGSPTGGTPESEEGRLGRGDRARRGPVTDRPRLTRHLKRTPTPAASCRGTSGARTWRATRPRGPARATAAAARAAAGQASGQ